ncbi:MAG: hypothetical protein SV422_01340 [Pseudomonadota bacterium]|nr:hypothetical protein [Pseudomonadota bacterium]
MVGGELAYKTENFTKAEAIGFLAQLIVHFGDLDVILCKAFGFTLGESKKTVTFGSDFIQHRLLLGLRSIHPLLGALIKLGLLGSTSCLYVLQDLLERLLGHGQRCQSQGGEQQYAAANPVKLRLH